MRDDVVVVGDGGDADDDYDCYQELRDYPCAVAASRSGIITSLVVEALSCVPDLPGLFTLEEASQ